MQYIQPGEPTQNAYVERNNGSIRRELLNAYMFTTLKEVREMARIWQKDYNGSRPHRALRYLTPELFYAAWLSRQEKPNETTEALSTSTSGGPRGPQAKAIVDKIFGKLTPIKTPFPIVLNTPN